MRRKRNWKNRIAIFLLAALAIGGGIWKYSGKPANGQDEMLVREREYIAAVGDITVGINAAGRLSGTPEPVYGVGGLTIESYLVEVGDRVVEGDPLAEYSRESLQKALGEAFDAYEKAQEALVEAQSAQKDGLTALVSRLTSEKKLNANTYTAYTKCLKNLVARLTNDQKATKERLRADPDDVQLTKRLESIEKELESVNLLLEEAKEFREAQKTAEKDSVPQTDADLFEIQIWEDRVRAAESDVRSKRERLLQVQALLEDAVICAQTDGIVTKLNVEAGGEVKAGQAILSLSTEKGWSCQLKVEQSDIASITEGQPVELIANAYPTETLNGSVSHIKYIAEDDGKYIVTARVEGDDLALMEGMDAYGTVILAKKEDVLTLSNKAIGQRDGVQYVNVRNEAGELVEKQITTGFSDGKVSEILSGLEPGDVAVVVDKL